MAAEGTWPLNLGDHYHRFHYVLIWNVILQLEGSTCRLLYAVTCTYTVIDGEGISQIAVECMCVHILTVVNRVLSLYEVGGECLLCEKSSSRLFMSTFLTYVFAVVT